MSPVEKMGKYKMGYAICRLNQSGLNNCTQQMHVNIQSDNWMGNPAVEIDL